MSGGNHTGCWRAACWALGVMLSAHPTHAEGPTPGAPKTTNVSARRAPNPSFASDAQRKQAQAYYDLARRQFENAEFEAALEHFTLAQGVVSSPNTQLYLARCLIELGRLTEAYQVLDEVIASAAALGTKQPRYAKTHEAASSERADLARRLAFVRVVVQHPKPQTQLFINGREVPRSAWPYPIVATPGAVEIALRTAGGTRHQKRVAVSAGKTREVVLDAGAQSTH